MFKIILKAIWFLFPLSLCFSLRDMPWSNWMIAVIILAVHYSISMLWMAGIHDEIVGKLKFKLEKTKSTYIEHYSSFHDDDINEKYGLFSEILFHSKKHS